MYPVKDADDVKAFFDTFADQNVEMHGPARALLSYRIQLLQQGGNFHPDHTLLDIGCGNGHHLFAMEGLIAEAVGIDISHKMIEKAREQVAGFQGSAYRFFQSDAATLPFEDHAFDRVICVGALEHMLDKARVLQEVHRVLKPEGRFVCLTLNGSYIWYRFIAPKRGYETRHLSSDHRITRQEAASLLIQAGFAGFQLRPWSFIPAGDMPARWAHILKGLDVLGKATGAWALRGGLMLSATSQSTQALKRA